MKDRERLGSVVAMALSIPRKTYGTAPPGTTVIKSATFAAVGAKAKLPRCVRISCRPAMNFRWLFSAGFCNRSWCSLSVCGGKQKCGWFSVFSRTPSCHWSADKVFQKTVKRGYVNSIASTAILWPTRVFRGGFSVSRYLNTSSIMSMPIGNVSAMVSKHVPESVSVPPLLSTWKSEEDPRPPAQKVFESMCHQAFQGPKVQETKRLVRWAPKMEFHRTLIRLTKHEMREDPKSFEL